MFSQCARLSCVPAVDDLRKEHHVLQTSLCLCHPLHPLVAALKLLLRGCQVPAAPGPHLPLGISHPGRGVPCFLSFQR